MGGSKGESYYDNKVWIFKSHIPSLMAPLPNITASKNIILIRNPFDIFLSLF
jgi:hypothetical protein